MSCVALCRCSCTGSHFGRWLLCCPCRVSWRQTLAIWVLRANTRSPQRMFVACCCCCAQIHVVSCRPCTEGVKPACCPKDPSPVPTTLTPDPNPPSICVDQSNDNNNCNGCGRMYVFAACLLLCAALCTRVCVPVSACVFVVCALTLSFADVGQVWCVKCLHAKSQRASTAPTTRRSTYAKNLQAKIHTKSPRRSATPNHRSFDRCARLCCVCVLPCVLCVWVVIVR